MTLNTRDNGLAPYMSTAAANGPADRVEGAA